MMSFVNAILLIVEIVSFVLTSLFGVIGVFDAIMGPAGVEKLLEKLHISLSYNQLLIIGFLSLAIMLITHLLRAKLSGRL